MKVKYMIAILIFFALLGIASAAYIPQEGIFAFREVENYTLHDINFTVPTQYQLKDSGDDYLTFKNGKEKLKITVEFNRTVKKVNSTKNIKANKTMLGSVKGYLVDKNGTYTFSYKQDNYLVTLKSKDLSLMMGAIGKDF